MGTHQSIKNVQTFRPIIFELYFWAVPHVKNNWPKMHYILVSPYLYTLALFLSSIFGMVDFIWNGTIQDFQFPILDAPSISNIHSSNQRLRFTLASTKRIIRLFELQIFSEFSMDQGNGKQFQFYTISLIQIWKYVKFSYPRFHLQICMLQNANIFH